MRKIKKVIWVIERKLIALFNYVSPRVYMKLYAKYLKNIGIKMGGGTELYRSIRTF